MIRAFIHGFRVVFQDPQLRRQTIIGWTIIFVIVAVAVVVTWNLKPDTEIVVEVVVETVEIPASTSTPNFQATQQAVIDGAAAEVTAMIDSARAQMTLESVNTELERQQALAGMTATAAADVLDSSVTITIVTPTPTLDTATLAGKGLRIVVVDDNSGWGGSVREQAIIALEEEYPSAVIEGFGSCSPVFLAKEFDLVIMDYQMEASFDGAYCTIAALKVHPDTIIIGYAADAQDERDLLDAGACEFVYKFRDDSLQELVFATKRCLDP